MRRDRPAPSRTVVAVALIALLAVVAGVGAWRWGSRPPPSADRRVPVPADRASILPKGAPSRFLQPQPVGLPIAQRTRPLVAHVTVVDLDKDGLGDIVACDVLANRVVWLRQAPRGTFTETTVGAEVRAPAHAEAVDLDRDGDDSATGCRPVAPHEKRRRASGG